MGEITHEELDARLACLNVGSRIGTTVHDIAGSVAELYQGASREDIRRIHQAILRDDFKRLEEARDAAKKACGWFDDSLVGNGIEKLLITGPNGSPEELAEILKEFTGTPGLYDDESAAVRDAPIKYDPPLLRNLRRVVQSRSPEPEKPA